MSKKRAKARSVTQLVANRGRDRRLTRDDAFTAYAMDRLLYRLGRSKHAKELYLKGGVLVANLVAAPHRFTRDIDVTRRHGPCDPDDLRQRFRDIIAVPSDDGVTFDASGVSAVVAVHDIDGYDGIRIRIRGKVDRHDVTVRVDVGFGDAIVPPAVRTNLQPFLDEGPPASVHAYAPEPVIAEKVETLVTKFPAIGHRLKDLLDVVMLSSARAFDGPTLVDSFQATFTRRDAKPDVVVLDDMLSELASKKWRTDWAAMRKEKAVVPSLELPDAIQQFDRFVRPLLEALGQGAAPGRWPPGGPWS